MAMAITTAVLFAFGFVAVTYVLAARPSTVRLVEALLLLVVVMAIQLVIAFPRLVRRLTPYRGGVLALQGLLTYGPFLVFQQAWMPLPGLLAGSVLLVLRENWRAWTGFAAVVLSTDVLQFWVGLGWRDVAYTTVSTVLTGLVVFGLSRLSDLVSEVHRSRAELAHLAVAQERLRFARDLHDLLGYSLSTITLKCELAYRLAPVDAGRAQQELTEILQNSRQALADVRAVASGYRDMCLATEVEDAKAMLATLGISAQGQVRCGTLPRAVDTVLATVLREGLTNMLRHSAVKQCTLSGERRGETVRFSLANDGVDRNLALPMAGEPRADCGGSGIRNLALRVERLGGRLEAGVRPDGWFELEAVLALPLPSAGHGTDDGAGCALLSEQLETASG